LQRDREYTEVAKGQKKKGSAKEKKGQAPGVVMTEEGPRILLTEKQRRRKRNRMAAVEAEIAGGPARGSREIDVVNFATAKAKRPSRTRRQRADKGVSKRLEKSARALGFDSYAAYLRSPHWRALRRQALDLAQRRCPCGARTELQVHHLTYARLGAERLGDLAVLCRGCHRRAHSRAGRP
jgi:hypothetical protein